MPGTGTVYIDAKLSVIRQRSVADGFHEALTIMNHDEKPVTLNVRIDAASDFADLFEVKDALKKKGAYAERTTWRGALVLGYKRDTYERQTWISSTVPAKVDAGGLTFRARVPAHGEWKTELDVVIAYAAWGEGQGATIVKGGMKRDRPSVARGLEKWLASTAPGVRFRLAEGDLPAQPRRHGGPPLLDPHHAQADPPRQPGCRGS